MAYVLGVSADAYASWAIFAALGALIGPALGGIHR
jgi:predicted branched-subunit amino acid permease